jgi:hypothetical protein
VSAAELEDRHVEVRFRFLNDGNWYADVAGPSPSGSEPAVDGGHMMFQIGAQLAPPGGMSGCEDLAPWADLAAKGLQKGLSSGG